MNTDQIKQTQTTVHGRYIIQNLKIKVPCPLLIGFHGYGETAEKQMKMMQKIPGINSWLCCSIQALHLFYNSKGDIGASWMTSQDRESRIEVFSSIISRIFSFDISGFVFKIVSIVLHKNSCLFFI